MIPFLLHLNLLPCLVQVAYPFYGYWEDIGTVKSFFDENLKLCRHVSNGELKPLPHDIMQEYVLGFKGSTKHGGTVETVDCMFGQKITCII